MLEKQFINAQQFLDAAHQLALQVYQSGFRPDFLVGIWRGGTPVAIAVHELLDYLGIDCQHFALRTSSYHDIEKRKKEIKISGLEQFPTINYSQKSLLIIDDVFDTGLSIQALLQQIQQTIKFPPSNIKLAMPYFKPNNNQTNLKPDYYLEETEQWLVFPHEINGLTEHEIQQAKPTLAKWLATKNKD